MHPNTYRVLKTLCVPHSIKLAKFWHNTYIPGVLNLRLRVFCLQTVEESTLLREGALSSVTSLLIVVLSKQFSSGNLYSIFKVYITITLHWFSKHLLGWNIQCYWVCVKHNKDFEQYAIFNACDIPAYSTCLHGYSLPMTRRETEVCCVS